MAGVVLYGEYDGETITQYANNIGNALDQNYVNYHFADATDISSWSLPYAKLVIYENLVNGTSISGKNYLKPKSNITRQETAKIISCFLEN